MNIDVQGLANRLTKRYKTFSKQIVEQRADILVNKIRSLLDTWYVETMKQLTKSALSRGFTNGRLNPHNSSSINNSLPMKVTGDLSRALYKDVTKTQIGNAIVIKITHGFRPVLNSSGNDYSNILDKSHPILGGFKERLFSQIDKRVLSLVKKGRFNEL